MGSSNIGVAQAVLKADTRSFDTSLRGAQEQMEGAGAAATAMAGKVVAGGAAFDRTATLQAKAVERARAAFQRELLVQDQRIAKEQEAARATELAALKTDILARSEQQLALKLDLAKLAFAGLGVATAAWSAVHFVDDIARSQVELGHLADKTGIAVTTLAGLREIAKEGGDDFDAISTGLIRMAKNFADSAAPSMALRTAMKGIGLSAKDLQGIPIEAQLQRIAVAFASTSNQGNKAAFAIAAFGKGGQALIPMLNREGGALIANSNAMGKLTGVTDESVAASQRWIRDEARMEAVLQRWGSFAIEQVGKVEAVLLAIPLGFETVAAAMVGQFQAIGAVAAAVGKLIADAFTFNTGALKGDIDAWSHAGGDAMKKVFSSMDWSWGDVGALWGGTGKYAQAGFTKPAAGGGDEDEDGAGSGSGGAGAGHGAVAGAAAPVSPWLSAYQAMRVRDLHAAIAQAPAALAINAAPLAMPAPFAGMPPFPMPSMPFPSAPAVTLAPQQNTAMQQLADRCSDLAAKFTDLGNLIGDEVAGALENFNKTLVDVLSTPESMMRGQHPWRQLGGGLAESVGASALRFGEGSLMKLIPGLGKKGDGYHVWVDNLAAAAVPNAGASLLSAVTGGGSADGSGAGGGSVATALGTFLTGGLLGFAGGGTIPGNMPVLVGERGPEILAGAAGRSVIPNGALGHSTVNNYIDARGSNDPAAMEATAHRVFQSYMPQMTAMLPRLLMDRNSRVPSRSRL